MAATFALAALLGGCASIDAQQSHTSSIIADGIPKWAGGEPANTPPRPAQEAAYPYVNALPAPRSEKPLTEEEQKKLAADLVTLRNRVNARAKAEPDDDRREADALARGKLAGQPKAPLSN
jgi:hypothetical protein